MPTPPLATVTITIGLAAGAMLSVDAKEHVRRYTSAARGYRGAGDDTNAVRATAMAEIWEEIVTAVVDAFKKEHA